jgi:4-amino-4-deoxy-L-arabinose transferase-like glycosyltransferase
VPAPVATTITPGTDRARPPRAEVDTPAAPTRLTRREWACLVLLLVAAAIAYALPLGERPLWNQDEARMALLAGDTLQHGPRLPARVRDVPYLNKPPLYFWAVALVSWPAGQVSERTAPIPSVVAALLTLTGVFAIGRHLTGPSTGLLAAAVLGASPGFFLHSNLVLPDMALAAALTWALYFLLRALHATPPQGRHLAGLYACVAAALWIKGAPAMLVLPAGLAATATARGWGGLSALRPGLGLALVALAILPWAIPYALTPGHEQSQSMGVGTALRWYLDRGVREAESIPMRGGVVMFLPWTLWLVPTALWWWRSPARGPYRPVIAWMAVEMVLLGLSVQQRPRYLLIVYPIFALLLAAAATGPGAGARALSRLHLAVVALLVLAVAAGGAWILLGGGPARDDTPLGALLTDPGQVLLLVVVLLVALVAALRELWRGAPPARAIACVAGGLALVLVVEAWRYPARMAAHAPVRAFAEAARPVLRDSAPIRAHPDANLAFDFYLDHRVVEERRRGAIAGSLEEAASSPLLLRRALWAELRGSAHASWCPLAGATIGAREFILVGPCR